MKILFLTYINPFSPKNGSEQRTVHLYNALKNLGQTDIVLINTTKQQSSMTSNDSKVIELHIDDVPLIIKRLKKISKRIAQYMQYLLYGDNLYIHYNLAKKIKNIYMSGQYDVIVSRYIYPAIHSDVFSYSNNVFMDFDDDPLQAFFSFNFKNRKKTLIYILLRINYEVIMKTRYSRIKKKATHIWLSNPEQCKEKNESVLINIPLISTGTILHKDQTDTFTVLFIGLLSHPPNRDGIHHFIKNIWSVLSVKNPLIQLRIIGVGASEEDKILWQSYPQIKLLGMVENIVEEYQKTDITIAPLYSGSGTNIKVLESAALGIPCIVSPFATRGFNWFNKKTFPNLIAYTDNEYINNVQYFINNRSEIKTIGNTLRSIVQTQYTFENFREHVHAAFIKNNFYINI